MTRRHVGRAATATRSSGRPRLVQHQPLETKSAPIGWNRPPARTRSMCPCCWADLTHFAHVEFCPACRRPISREGG
jgi:hypothetical protein